MGDVLCGYHCPSNHCLRKQYNFSNNCLRFAINWAGEDLAAGLG